MTSATARSYLLTGVLLMAVAVGTPAGMAVMKTGVRMLGETQTASPEVDALVLVTGGFAVYLIAFLAGLVLLARHKLSVIYPVALGLTIACTNAVSLWQFDEGFTVGDMVGGALVLAGVVSLGWARAD